MADKERILDLEAKLASALGRIAELESQLAKKSIAKTSGNSHLPPSKDIARKNQSLREKSGKPVGGQVGHKGHTLEMTPSPDKTEKLYPDFCNECGFHLAGQTFKMASRRQVIDIPTIVPTVTEYQCFGTVCRCGHHQAGTFPQGVDNHVQYGKNIQALVVYQNCYQFVPFARLQDFFRKVCNLDMGKGTIENIIRRTAQRSIPVYDALNKVIAVSFFVGSDETGFKVKGAKHWFWVWQNAMVTYIVAACSRSKQVILDVFPDGLPNSILCTDRLAAQLSTISKGTQICLAHLLRDLVYLIEAEKTPWANGFKALLQDAIRLKQDKASYDRNDALVLEIEARADKLLHEIWLSGQLADKTKYKQTITFFRGMAKLRHGLFPFLYDARIPFDNNGSERAIRVVKIKTKISGQFKSLQQEFAIIRSLIDTAIKNGGSVFHAIHAMIDMPLPK